MAYLDNFYEQVEADTEYKKIIATAGCIAFFSAVVTDKVAFVHEDTTGDDISLDMEVEEMQSLLGGDFEEDAFYLIEAFGEFDRVTVYPYFDEKEFKAKALKYLQDNEVPYECIVKLGVTKDVWNEALDLLSKSMS